MLLGNSLTGLSLTLDRLLDELVTQRPAIEARLALGASLREAVSPHVREAVRGGMIPILNSMSVVGIVSLPGMMTGQIMSGTNPQRAVAYQILIMFMMAGSTALAIMVWTALSLRALRHPDARIDWDRITRR
jgi:putative ABC transport system permease protein